MATIHVFENEFIQGHMQHDIPNFMTLTKHRYEHHHFPHCHFVGS